MRQPTTFYSLFSLGEAIPSSARYPSSFGIIWSQSVYFIFSFGIPLVFLVVAFGLWLLPLTLMRQRQLFILSEVLYAWSGLEVIFEFAFRFVWQKFDVDIYQVFILSILATVMQISTLALFIVGDRCDQINLLLAAAFDGPLQV